jgi:hypothetical protein
MPPRRPVVLICFLLLAGTSALAQARGAGEDGEKPPEAQSSLEDYKVYAEHPRLLLPPRRLRLLRREKERQSIRWQQFDLLMRAGARMPEPGFALALYSQASTDPEACRQGAEWLLRQGSDLRQLALVFDWCQAALDDRQKRAMITRLEKGLQTAGHSSGTEAIRDRVLAAIALADHTTGITEKQLQSVVEKWWRGQTVPALRNGKGLPSRRDLYALMEILHAVRDNLHIDLRDDVPLLFRDLPEKLLASYYPAAYPAAENEYRIPAVKGGTPDLDVAVLARAAELSLVAFDPNLQGCQFLQSWLIHDRFLMRSAQAIPYEFLWANPYQPGVTYYHIPLVHHDPVFGQLFLRSSWEEEGTWLGYFDGELQLFENGEVKILKPGPETKAQFLADAAVFLGGNPLRLKVDNPDTRAVFVVGLAPRRRYELEADDEEMREETSDAGGILRFHVTPRPRLMVRIREAPGRAGGGPSQ